MSECVGCGEVISDGDLCLQVEQMKKVKEPWPIETVGLVAEEKGRVHLRCIGDSNE